MSGSIYLIQEGDRLLEMTGARYDSEERLQRLLAQYPNLLAGEQMNSSNPRQWLLIAREVDVPATEGGSTRWSVDHLFLDQDGIPTIVEVKRSTDSRIRREVVGQMLEYAANAVAYWPVEEVRSHFESTCQTQGLDPDQELLRFLGEETALDQFWLTVKTNLQAGRVRLVFVADEIPPELQRIVEFLNGQMDPAEVLAVEVRQFVAQGVQALVPRVVGQSAGAQQRKGAPTAPSRQWDEPTFLEHLSEQRGPSEVDVARRVLTWARSRELRVTWGKGKQDGTFNPVFVHERREIRFIQVWTDGSITIQFGSLMTRSPFDDEMLRRDLLKRLNEIDGISISEERIAGYPSIALTTLASEPVLELFLQAFDWVIQVIKQHTSTS